MINRFLALLLFFSTTPVDPSAYMKRVVACLSPLGIPGTLVV
jgi:hypothetical protein